MARRYLPVLPEGFADPELPTGTFSSTQYGLYKNKCAHTYKLRYVDKLRTPPSGAMLTGVAIHAGAEHAHLHIKAHQTLPHLEAAVTAATEHFEEQAEQVETWEEGLDAGTTKDRVVRGYTAYHREALPKVRPVEAEALFVKRVGTVPMVGYIDLIDAPSPGELVVADLKTTRASWSQSELDKDTQFTLYAAVTGVRKVRVDNLVFLKAGPEFKQKTAVRADEDIRNLVEDLEETTDLIKRGIFPKAPIDSWGCSPKWCEYWDRCRGRKL